MNCARRNHRICIRTIPRFHHVSVVLLLAGALTCRAVDPLPDYLRDAPEEAKRAYAEREARESRRLQLEVGQRRYDGRMKFQESVNTFAAGISEQNMADFREATGAGHAPVAQSDSTSETESSWWWKVLAGLGLLAVFAGRDRLINRFFGSTGGEDPPALTEPVAGKPES